MLISAKLPMTVRSVQQVKELVASAIGCCIIQGAKASAGAVADAFAMTFRRCERTLVTKNLYRYAALSLQRLKNCPLDYQPKCKKEDIGNLPRYIFDSNYDVHFILLSMRLHVRF